MIYIKIILFKINYLILTFFRFMFIVEVKSHQYLTLNEKKEISKWTTWKKILTFSPVECNLLMTLITSNLSTASETWQLVEKNHAHVLLPVLMFYSLYSFFMHSFSSNKCKYWEFLLFKYFVSTNVMDLCS